VGEVVAALGAAEDADALPAVALPAVAFPAVALPPPVVLFPDVAFCANEGIVLEFIATAIRATASTTAAKIKPSIFCVFCMSTINVLKNI
jgi:hypothetical protein